MNRMDIIFKENIAKKRGSLVLYFPICDSILEDKDVEWAGKYFDHGCDVLEIGLPYKDPCYDGPTVANSMKRAIANVDGDLDKVFARIKDIRDAYPNNILQIITYYENVDFYGFEEFARKCGEAGVDGVLCANLPLKKTPVFDSTLGKYNVYNCRFALYNMTDEQLADLKNNSKGYVFLQAVDGATGARNSVDPANKEHIKYLKDNNVTTPIFAGFGITTGEHVRKLMDYGADGVIVGSNTISHIIAGDAAEYIDSITANLIKH